MITLLAFALHYQLILFQCYSQQKLLHHSKSLTMEGYYWFPFTKVVNPQLWACWKCVFFLNSTNFPCFDTNLGRAKNILITEPCLHVYPFRPQWCGMFLFPRTHVIIKRGHCGKAESSYVYPIFWNKRQYGKECEGENWGLRFDYQIMPLLFSSIYLYHMILRTYRQIVSICHGVGAYISVSRVLVHTLVFLILVPIPSYVSFLQPQMRITDLKNRQISEMIRELSILFL